MLIAAVGLLVLIALQSGPAALAGATRTGTQRVSIQIEVYEGFRDE